MSDRKNILLASPYGTDIKNIVEYCVSLVSADLLADLKALDANITGVHFFSGHYLEITAELEKLSKAPSSKNARYPLVALLRDLPEVNGASVGVDKDTLNILICTRTQSTYTSDQREQKTFKPILQPIAYALIKQLELSGKFMSQGTDQQSYTWIEHYFWGREGIYGSTSNIFNDWIDCIELKNLDLKLYDYGR